MEQKTKIQEFKKIGQYTTESVFKHTNKHWDVWITLLNKAGAKTSTHKEIVHILKTKYKLTPWWQQAVAIGYEIAVGIRLEGQNHKGLYSTTATKSIYASKEQLFKTIISTTGQSSWLLPLSPVEIKPKNMFETDDGFFGEIRTIHLNKRIRLSWQDPEWDKKTTVQIDIVPKEKDKCLLVISHTDLRTEKIKKTMSDRWKKAVNNLKNLIEP